ncbi:hypothetical protein GCM10027200_06630 [Lentzea nigeriaca]
MPAGSRASIMKIVLSWLPTAQLAVAGLISERLRRHFSTAIDVHESAIIRAFGDEHQTGQPPARLNGAQPSRDALPASTAAVHRLRWTLQICGATVTAAAW